MSRGRRPDSRRRKTSHPHASYLACGNGEKHGAYMAGQVYGCYGHRTHAHQPCVSDLTETQLQCPYCASGLVAEWRGYVPLWDQDWALRYVLIGEEIFDSVDAIEWRSQVIVCRARPARSPLVVRAGTPLSRELPQREPYTRSIAMLRVCLTLWGIPALTDWIEHNQPLSLAETDGKAVRLAPPSGASKPAKPADDTVPLADLMSERRIGKMIARGKPSANGDVPH